MLNAIDAMPGGGHLHVNTNLCRSPTGSRGLDATADTGKGIPADDLERIYEPFFTKGKAMASAPG